MCWRSVAFLRGRERRQGGCRRHVRRYCTDSQAWRRWRRNAKRRGKRIQNARGQSHTTVRAVVVHLRESLMAIGAVNIDGHTHFCEKTPTTQSCGAAHQHGIVMPSISYCQEQSAHALLREALLLTSFPATTHGEEGKNTKKPRRHMRCAAPARRLSW